MSSQDSTKNDSNQRVGLFEPTAKDKAKRDKRLNSATGIPSWWGYPIFRFLVVNVVGKLLMKSQLHDQHRLPQSNAKYCPPFYRRSTKKQISPHAYVIAPNHTNELDIALVGKIKRPMTWLCKPFFVAHPIAAFINQRVGAVPMLRSKDEPWKIAIAYNRKEAMAKIQKSLSKGIPAVVYPQGERQDKGEVNNVYLGAAIIAIRANVPLVPFAIYGLAKDDDKWKTRLLKRVQARGIVMSPLYPADYPDEVDGKSRAEAMMEDWQKSITEGRVLGKYYLKLSQ